MNFKGKVIVKNDEGIREEHEWGWMNKLLCEETTGDPNFTFGEIEYAPGGLRGPVEGHEAFHCLRGHGKFTAWTPQMPDKDPIVVSLQPGMEFYVRGDIPRSVENTGSEPLFGIFMHCHMDRPCHAHYFSHPPGVGNTLHYHGKDKWVEPVRQEFVEAMYLIEGPGAIATADPTNTRVEDHIIEEGTAVYHPLNTLHRQYNPSSTGNPNFWIHAGFYYGEGRPTAGIFDIPEFTFWHREK